MEIAKELLVYLFTYGELGLPGLGNFSIRMIPAKKMVHEKKIYGPQIFIDFTSDTTQDQSGLTRILTKKYRIKKSNAERKLHQYSTYLINQLLNVKEAPIPDLGLLYVTKDGEIKFEPDPKLNSVIETQFPDLAINIIPVEIAGSSKKGMSPVTFPQTFEKEEKIGWFFPLLSLVATSLLFACLITCFLQQKMGIKSAVSGQSTVIISKDPVLSEGNDDLIMNSAIGDTLKSIENPEETEYEDAWNPELYEDSSGAADYVKEYGQLQTNEMEEGSDFNNVESMTLDEILRISANKRLNKINPCMIVVGSYQRRDLLNKMIRQLQDLKHEIYVEKYGGFYRTAILFDCSEQDALSFLREIRKSVEKNAWLLKY